MQGFNLITPALAETACTGFILGAEKTIDRATWRVEFWRAETYPRIMKDGARVAVAMVPERVARFVNQVSATLDSLRKLQTA